jgi:hypothetical protein
MATYQINKSIASQKITGLYKIPSITGVTRLETQPTAVNLKAGLQAQLADPLWMLSRQWQFNEFQGEDAGTPLRVAFSINGTEVDAFRSGKLGDAPWQTLSDGDAPIETRVEAEAAWSVHPRLRGEAGLHAMRMASPVVRAALLAAYPISFAPIADPDADQAGLMWTTLFAQRTVDAALLANDVRPLLNNDGTLNGVPAALALPADEVDACKAMLQRWIAWLDAAVYEGNTADAAHTSWQTDRMEYAFALKAGTVQLSADEYTDGHLDWDDFEAGPLEGDPQAGAQPITQTFAVATRHPSPVRYPGMPAERYWEFEDGNVNFAGAEAGITDFLRMSVTEFALTFGNDWFVVPIRLPVGWLYQVATFAITDSFGLVTTPLPIRDDDGALWTMYSLTADPRLQGTLHDTMLLADSLDGVQEGAVLEETHLARDEMANLAWAIEKKVQGVSGEPIDRDLEARSLAFQQRIAFDQQPDSPQLVYRLATPVPANWIPLLPIRQVPLDFNAPLTIELIRAGMKRFYPELDAIGTGVVDADYTAFLATLDDQPNFITPQEIGDGLRSYTFYPRGYMLRDDPTVPMADSDTRVIAEEEVPRIGATLRRKFQYARSSDGRTWLWVGRSKTAGRGEADSKLQYDVAVNRSTLR